MIIWWHLGWYKLARNPLLAKNFSEVANTARYCNGSDSEVYDNSNECTIMVSNKVSSRKFKI